MLRYERERLKRYPKGTEYYFVVEIPEVSKEFEYYSL